MNSEITKLLFELVHFGNAKIPVNQETALLNLIKRLDFGGVVYVKAKDSQLPQEILNFSKHSYYRNFVRNKQLLEFYSEAKSIFTKNDIRYQTLKGIWLLQNVYSENIGIRFLSDIDILIHPFDKEKVTNILLSEGFELRNYGLNKINPSQESFCKYNFKIDLHYEIKELNNIDLLYMSGLNFQMLLSLHYVIHVLHLHRHLSSTVYRPIWVHDCFEILKVIKYNNIQINTSFLHKKRLTQYRLVHSFIDSIYSSIKKPKHKLGGIFHENEMVALYEFKRLMYYSLFNNALKRNIKLLRYTLTSELSVSLKFKIAIEILTHNLVRLQKILSRISFDIISYFWMKIKTILK